MIDWVILYLYWYCDIVFGTNKHDTVALAATLLGHLKQYYWVEAKIVLVIQGVVGQKVVLSTCAPWHYHTSAHSAYYWVW